jgi:hypothetical protein
MSGNFLVCRGSGDQAIVLGSDQPFGVSLIITHHRGVEQRQLAWLITMRSEVRVLSPQP